MSFFATLSQVGRCTGRLFYRIEFLDMTVSAKRKAGNDSTANDYDGHFRVD